ncbi:hypothetical protein ACH5RR_009520 [Cinchona calisaya]|uniref:Uncharacterized protein n=1 Tax=Cinchona calisaya TaxID=153742 RepID=A0ABD3AGE4_9GENT
MCFQYLLLHHHSPSLGTIPKCFVNSSDELVELDLRRNELQGTTPTTSPKGSQMRYLGLNCNKLEGPLPQSLLNCQELEVLDLGNNNLIGRIPEGNQFHTFGNDSSSGNLALCGFPLTKICGDTEASQPPSTLLTFGQGENDSDDVFSGFSWKPVVMGYAWGMELGLAIGCPMFLIE